MRAVSREAWLTVRCQATLSRPADTADLTRYKGTSRLCSDDEQFTNHTTLARGRRPDYGEEYRSQQLEAVGL